jgi:FKBP-type peptidyl-prolyl cis-trans isomerase SlyD
MTEIVKDGMVVSIAYTLRLASGELVDASPADEPLEYLHGAENIVPGLERELTGLQLGAKKDVVVSPEDGYGDYDPEFVEVVDRADLPKDLPIQLGMTIAVTDDEGYIDEAIVREISKTSVTLDFNHPLAGQKLFFEVEVVAVREASEDEMAHGHPHSLELDEDDEFFDEDFEDELDDDFEDDDFEDEDDEDDDEKPRRK